MKTKAAVLPIWKIVISEKLYYFVLGTSKKVAIENIKNNEDLIFEGNSVFIEYVNPDDAHNILLQLDLDDEEEYTTLFEEAKYYSEHNIKCDYFLASSFDVIADFNLHTIVK